MNCLTIDQLEILAASNDTSDEQTQHLEQCKTCSEKLEEVKDNLRLASQIQNMQHANTVSADAPGPGQPRPEIHKDAQKFEVGDLIARGGIGAVKLSHDRNLQREVAMKVLLPKKAKQPEQVLRFIEEAQVAGQLDHPNIVPVHELGEDEEGRPFYTMKFVKGVSLAEIINSIKRGEKNALAEYPLTRLLTMFMKICDGVAFAHSKGVIHRDLKPENIMVGDYGEVLVLDWGLAKVVGDSESPPVTSGEGEGNSALAADHSELREAKTVAAGDVEDDEEEEEAVVATPRVDGAIKTFRSNQDVRRTMEGDVYGTPEFMAPEQASGKVDLIDQRTDIYALGGILYNILTLHAPVTGKEVKEILEKVQRGDITSPSVYTEESVRNRNKSDAYVNSMKITILRHLPGGRIPEPLAAIAMKALSGQRSRRYQQVNDLRHDIERFIENRAVSAHSDSSWEVLVRLFQRNTAASIASLVASAVIVVLVVVGYGLNMNERRKAELMRDQAVVEAKNAEQARADAESARSLSEQASRDMLESSFKVSEMLASQAIRAAEEGRFAEAEVRAEAAQQISDLSPWGFYALGSVSQMRGSPDEARARFSEALKRDESHAPTKLALAELDKTKGDLDAAVELLASPGKANSWRDLEKAGDLFMQAKRYADAETAFNLGLIKMGTTTNVKEFDKNDLTFKHEDARGWRMCDGFYKSIVQLPQQQQIVLLRKKFEEVHSQPVSVGTEFKDRKHVSVWLGENAKHLHPLHGMELTTLNIGSRQQVRSVEPLRGMPLRSLSLQFTDVRDISPLQGMPLEYFDCINGVRDISVLKGMPLKTFMAPRYVKSLDVLAGMQLEKVVLYASQVRDLEPLRGMPISHLSLSGSITDISILKEMPLEHVESLQVNRFDISFLREMKTLKTINKTPVSEFWKKADDWKSRQEEKEKLVEVQRLKDIEAAKPEGWKFETRSVPDLGLELVHLPSGTFTMGSANGQPDETPHEVTINRPFWIGKTEVTQDQFVALQETNRSKFKGGNRPVENLNWWSAFNWTYKLTNKERKAGRLPEGYVYRLPTEAEWEYACRAGTTGDYYFGSMKNYEKHVWNVPLGAKNTQTTHDVATLQPNPWGLYDMHGNVMEFCLDRCDRGRDMTVISDTYKGKQIDPVNDYGSCFVVRPGGAMQGTLWYRAAERNLLPAQSVAQYVGFRVVLAPEDVAMKVYESLAAAKVDENGIGVDPISAGSSFSEGSVRLVFKNDGQTSLLARARVHSHDLIETPAKLNDVIVEPKLHNKMTFTLRSKAEPLRGFHAIPFDYELVDPEKPEGEPITKGSSVIHVDTHTPCKKHETKIRIDGNMSDWNDLPFGTHESAVAIRVSTDSRDPQDMSYKFGVVWDEDNVYFGAEVTDDVFVQQANIGDRQPWKQDGLSLYLDARPSPYKGWNRGQKPGEEFLALHVCPSTNPETPFVYRPRKDYVPEGVRVVALRTDSGYNVEVAVPKSYLDEMYFGEWQSFRLNANVSDFDDPNNIDTKDVTYIHWRPSWHHPHTYFGSGTFVRSGKQLPFLR